MRTKDDILLENAYKAIFENAEENEYNFYMENPFEWSKGLQIGKRISIRKGIGADFYKQERGVIKELKPHHIATIELEDGRITNIHTAMLLPYVSLQRLHELKDEYEKKQNEARKLIKSLKVGEFYKTKDGGVYQLEKGKNGTYSLFGAESNSSIPLNIHNNPDDLEVREVLNLQPATEEETQKAKERIQRTNDSMADFYKHGVTGT